MYLLRSRAVQSHYGASLVAKYFGNSLKSEIARICLEDELALWNVLEQACGILEAAVDVYQGGVAIALAKACVRGNMGAVGIGDWDFQALFAEAPTQVLVALESQNVAALQGLLEGVNLELTQIAVLGGSEITLGEMTIPLKAAQEIFYHSFEKTLLAQ